MSLTGVLISEKLNPLEENAFLLMMKGSKLSGWAITLAANPAFSLIASNGAKYNASLEESTTTTSALDFIAAWLTQSANALALNVSSLGSLTFRTLSAP